MTDSKIQILPDIQEVEMEARAWFVRFEEGGVRETDIASFERWRGQSAVHEEAYRRVSQFWGDLDVAEKFLNYAESGVVIQSLQEHIRSRKIDLVRRICISGIAASFVLIACIGAFHYGLIPSRPFTAEYATVIGEQRVIDLEDGSRINLNTNSAVIISYSQEGRAINLTKGEAYFEVASDKRRPFVVQTKKGFVTAVGTAFFVGLRAEKLDVAVAEGRVALGAVESDPLGSLGKDISFKAEPGVIEVSAGQAAVIDQGVEAVSVITKESMNRVLDWRDGQLNFDGETLEEVVNEVSRYADLKIEISGDDLKKQKIIAYCKISNIRRFFDALSMMDNIEVEHVNANHVRLYRAD